MKKRATCCVFLGTVISFRPSIQSFWRKRVMDHNRMMAKIFSRSGTLILGLAIVLGVVGQAHAAQAYRYYKFQQTQLRDSPSLSNSIQMDELQVYDNTGQIIPVAALGAGNAPNELPA